MHVRHEHRKKELGLTFCTFILRVFFGYPESPFLVMEVFFLSLVGLYTVIRIQVYLRCG